jgi:hypothetical protein
MVIKDDNVSSEPLKDKPVVRKTYTLEDEERITKNKEEMQK